MIHDSAKKKRRGRKPNPEKKDFFQEVKNISIYMPRGYAIKISDELDISIHIVYNVRKGKTMNKKVLNEMKKIKEEITA
jgi:hypothetical protein